METRPYFIAGDLSCSLLVGGATAVAAIATFSEAWPVPAAMLVGMLLGMAVAAVGILAFGRFFGMIELQMPAMLSGMLAGMIVAMIVTRRPLPSSTGAIIGGVLGMATFVAVWLADAWLGGQGARWTR
jgi:hypothetical protein